MRRLAHLVRAMRMRSGAWTGLTGWPRRARRPVDRWVHATAFDPGFAEGDSAYNAVCAGRDDRLYFTICTHRIDSHARLGCFEPRSQTIVFLKDVGAALGEDPSVALPQGKIHTPLADAAGRLYLATMPGYYHDDRQGRDAYPGFHVMCLDLRSGTLSDVIRGPAEEGLITAVLDPGRLMYYGLTYPSGLFCRVDVRAGTLETAPRPCADRPTSQRIHGRPLYPICRSLGLDPDGVVYGSCQDGSIWCCEPRGGPRLVPGPNVAHGVVPPIDRRGRLNSFWRVVLWHQEDRCFYGIHAGTQSLFRFDPDRRRIEPLSRLGPTIFHLAPHAPLRSQLGLTVGPDRTLYYIAHGPPVRLDGRVTPRTSASLIRYHLDGRRFEELGPIRTDAGERALFAESLAADREGNLYTMAWVEVTDPDQWPRYRRLRAEASNGECSGEVYRLLLLRIPRAELGQDRV